MPPIHPLTHPPIRCFRMNLPCRKRLVKKGASGSIRGGGVDPTPIIDLVIETSDPRPFTEIYMQVRACAPCGVLGWGWGWCCGWTLPHRRLTPLITLASLGPNDPKASHLRQGC